MCQNRASSRRFTPDVKRNGSSYIRQCHAALGPDEWCTALALEMLDGHIRQISASCLTGNHFPLFFLFSWASALIFHMLVDFSRTLFYVGSLFSRIFVTHFLPVLFCPAIIYSPSPSYAAQFTSCDLCALSISSRMEVHTSTHAGSSIFARGYALTCQVIFFLKAEMSKSGIDFHCLFFPRGRLVGGNGWSCVRRCPWGHQWRLLAQALLLFTLKLWCVSAMFALRAWMMARIMPLIEERMCCYLSGGW